MLNIGSFARLGQVSPRTLRHYEQQGLLQPERVDPATGYRSYSVRQLGRLHQLLALRDLGFSLEQIRDMVDSAPSPSEMRGMLRLREAQIAESVAEEQARLRRVEAHIRALERNPTMPATNVVIKQTNPLRIAEAVGVAPGFGSENLHPLFGELLPIVAEHVMRQGANLGMSVAHYEDPADNGSIVLHAGFDVGDQTVSGDDRVRIVDLPVIEVASVVHRGAMDTITETYEALLRWVEDSGYRATGYSRELYHEWTEDPAGRVTELQMPIAR
jgi:DNA-binding transcriptional MerR regulator